VLTALGRPAEAARDELLAMRTPETQAEREAAEAERRRPLARARLRRVLCDFLVADGRIPGVDN
jgi:hypothetical protein